MRKKYVQFLIATMKAYLKNIKGKEGKKKTQIYKGFKDLSV